jgi:ribosomal protein L37AE/L43A
MSNSDVLPEHEVEQFYDRLDASEVSTSIGSRFDITCPGCGHATQVNLEVWDCEHCDETLALFVGSFASTQNQEKTTDCADANTKEVE